MIKGNNWTGAYSRFVYNEAKQYVMLLKEKNVPILDDEFNCLQEILLTLMRRYEQYTLGDGSADTGFMPVGTSATNNFTIKGGTYFLQGWLLTLSGDITYSTQPITQAALTTPVANRTDYIYLDVWQDEIDTSEDSQIVDPTLGTDTSHRLKLNWAIKVVQGAAVPVSYTDTNNLYHVTKQIGHIYRTATATITPPMITDDRRIFFSSPQAIVTDTISQVAWFARTSAPTGWLVCDGTNVSRTTYANLFAAIGITFGPGDGSTTFGLPKLNDGKFVRGWNNTGTGPDAGRVFGSYQSDAFLQHKHISPFAMNQNMTGGTGTVNPAGMTGLNVYSDPPAGKKLSGPFGWAPSPWNTNDIFGPWWSFTPAWDYNNCLQMTSGPYDMSTHTTTDATGNSPIGDPNETRPYNVALLPCIRYQ